jgi:hypothetical protein
MATAAQIREIATSFEGTVEEPHFEKTSFRMKKKIYATLKGTVLVVKLSEVDQSVFVHIDGVYPVPKKWGKHGWTIFEIDKLSLDIVRDGLSKSYALISAS